MKTINIFLETEDLAYGMALARSLQQYTGFFSIQMDGNGGACQSDRRDAKDYDLFLTDNPDAREARIVFLTDEAESAGIDEAGGHFSVHKYQHVGNISSVLRLAHSVYSKSEMVSDQTERVNVISVCASTGGAGCTSVALGICQELTRYHGKRTLYVSLEEFESTGAHFPAADPNHANITRFLYGVIHKQDPPNWTAEGYLLRDGYGVSAFRPARGRNPLRELDGNGFVKFINQVNHNRLFTDLILDCGNGLDDAIVSAFQLSSSVCHVTGKVPDSIRKAAYLRAVACRSGMTDGVRMVDVLNFHEEPEEADAASRWTPDPERFLIEEDTSSFYEADGGSAICLDKAFGQGIRGLVHHLTDSVR